MSKVIINPAQSVLPVQQNVLQSVQQVVQAPLTTTQLVQQPCLSNQVFTSGALTGAYSGALQSQVIQAPIQTQAFVQPTSQVIVGGNVSQICQPQIVSSTNQVYGVVKGNQCVNTVMVDNVAHQVQAGGSRIEYIPFEKTFTQYDQINKVEYIPHEKKQTDYWAVEYQTEHIPYVYTDKFVDYLPQDRVQERVEYQAIEKQVVHAPSEKQVVQVEGQQSQQAVVQQPITTSRVVTAPAVQQVQQVQQVQAVQSVLPVQQQQIVERVVQAPVQTSVIGSQIPVHLQAGIQQGYSYPVNQSYAYGVNQIQNPPLTYSTVIPQAPQVIEKHLEQKL